MQDSDITITARKELYGAFKDVIYTDLNHTYRIGDDALQSCTSIVGKLKKPFPRDIISNAVAKKKGVSQKEVLDLWEKKRIIGASRGTYVHETLENLYKGKRFPTDYKIDLSMLSELELIDYHTQAQAMVKFGENFINDHPFLIPIATELVVGDPYYKIGGTIDNILYNTDTETLHIYDWKTDKKFNKTSKTKCLEPIDHLPDTEFTKYSLQMSIYRHIVEMNTGIELGDSYAVWLSPINNDNYKVIPLNYYEDELSRILPRRSLF